MTISQITHEAMALPPGERIVLAQQLWDSTCRANPASIDAEAVDEAVRRDAELERGGEQEISHEELMAAARKALRCE